MLARGGKTRRTALAAAVAAALVWGMVGAPAAGASTSERQLLSILNRAREHHGLRTLKDTSSLTDDSRRHTRKMIRRGELFDPPDLADILRPYPYRIGASVSGCADSLRGVVRLWMGHDIHRTILLTSQLRRAAAGVVHVDGKSACGRDAYWATVIMYG